MANTYFQALEDGTRGGRYLAGPDTAGPWDRALQHGGPPNALAVRAAERLAAATHSDAGPLTAARLASEFVGPVPVAELEVSARVLRAARSAVLVSVTIAAGGRECLHSRVWLTRDRDTASVAPPADRPAPLPPADAPAGFSLHFPYGDSVEWHEMVGSATTPGPAAVWARPTLGLVDGEPADTLSGLQRVALVGDSASGVSAALDWDEWTFLNVDLDVHLSRPHRGEWVHLDAATDVGPAGFALARSRVSDQHGPVGVTAQTLLLAARAGAPGRTGRSGRLSG